MTATTNHTTTPRRRIARRAGLSASALAAAVLVIGGGAALFSDSAEVEQEISVGSVAIDLSGTGSFQASIDAVGPGDQEQRFLTVENESSLELGELTLSVDYDGDDALGDELGFNVTVCSFDDLPEGPDGPEADDCTGQYGETVVGSSGPGGTYTFESHGDIDQVSFDVASLLDDFNDNEDLAVRVIVEFDEDADNDAQSTSGTINYEFEATQRAPQTVG